VRNEDDAHALILSLFIILNRFLHSAMSRLDVGSSSIRIFALISSALAIATICWIAVSRRRGGELHLFQDPVWQEHLGFMLMAFQSILAPFMGWRPI
jgi:hypothetical protein